MGQIKRYTLENGKTFRAYVPDNVSNDTPVFYYSYVVGSNYDSDSLWQGYEENMISQNPNSIIIIPEDRELVVGNSNVATHKYQNNAVAAVALLEQELGIKTTQFTNGGFSAGFGFAVRTTAHYLQANPDAERQTLIAVDGVMNDSTCIQSSELEAIKNNNSIIISYSQPQNFQYQARKLKVTGLPILYIVDPNVPEDSGNKYWGYHDYMTKNYFDSGLYEEVMSFVNGKGELPGEYSYRVYDPATGEIRNINRDEVAEFFGIEEYVEMEPFTFNTLNTLNDYEIKSKSSVMTKHLNNIKANISSSSILGSSWGNTVFDSTTRVPSEIPNVYNELFSASSELLTKLANEIFQFAKVTADIEELNDKLEHEAEQLNDGIVIESIHNKPIVEEQIISDNNVVKDKENDEVLSVVPSVEFKEENEIVIPSTDIKKDNGMVIPVVPIYPSVESNSELITKPSQENKFMDLFPKYDELYSDETKVVYEYEYDNGEKCKIVIHKDKNDKILGIEHYYEYDSVKEATNALSILKDEYREMDFFKEVKQDKNHVKVIFSDEMYKGMSIAEVKEKYYRDLDEVLEEE